MSTMLLDPVRRAARLSGPAAALSLVLFFTALAVHGDVVDLSRTALAVASNAVALVSVAMLLLGLVHLAATRPVLQDRAGCRALLVAGTGTLLVAGGAWTQLVALPVFAVEAPRVAQEGAGLITAAYVVSFLVAGVGWLLVAMRLRHDPSLRRAGVRLLLAGSVLALAPLPTRWVVLAVAVSVLASARPVAAPAGSPVPAAA